MKDKVVLAYSGGLDTSVLIKWFVNKGFEVIAFLADLGQGKNLKKLEDKALKCGASKAFVKNLTQEFVDDFIIPTLKAGAVYEGGYFLSTALGRPLIAKELVKVAKLEDANAVAHGCSGKGNDQVRFEVAINALAPELKVIAPLRDWEFKSRQEEVDYALGNDIPIDVKKDSPYSLDMNIWGVSIECGQLEDPQVPPSDEVYQITKKVETSPDKPKFVKISFEEGIPVALDGEVLDKITLINKLTSLGCEYGIGRSDMIENRLVGIKSREIYEAPAATILYNAHMQLESLVLTKDVLDFKKIVANKYAELIYNGLWFTDLRSCLDKFINSTQENVSGEVELKLYKGSCICAKRKSEYSLYDKEMATYDEGDKFDHKAAEGFIKIFGLPYRKKK